MELQTLTTEAFKALPLVVEGESKEVRYCGDGEVVIGLKPTIYSYTHNRSGVLPGSETLRLRAIAALLPVLRANGIHHTYQEVTDRWIRSTLVLQPTIEGQPAPFVPTDISPEAIAQLPKAPPIEVVAKAVHSGTPKHRYYGLSDYPLRSGQPPIAAEQPYPEPIIRFDWRNPLHDAAGTRLADEVLPESMAEWFIDTETAKKTAQIAFDGLKNHLQQRDLNLWDICFFLAEDGNTMFGEVSPDCLRVRAIGGVALDKDVWRAGGSSAAVMEKWEAFVNILEAP